jgi:hypothetical protein
MLLTNICCGTSAHCNKHFKMSASEHDNNSDRKIISMHSFGSCIMRSEDKHLPVLFIIITDTFTAMS